MSLIFSWKEGFDPASVVKEEEEDAFVLGEMVPEEGGHRLNPKCQSSNFKF